VLDVTPSVGSAHDHCAKRQALSKNIDVYVEYNNLSDADKVNYDLTQVESSGM